MVTGATGFLGSHLVKSLLAAGHEVVAVKRSTSSMERLNKVADRVTLVDADRADFDRVFSTPPHINGVLHTATSYGRKGEREADVREANTGFPTRLLKAAIDAGVPLFINVDTPLPAATSLYAETKKAFLATAQRMCKGSATRLINVPMEQVYGPGDDDSKFTSYVIGGCADDVESLALTAGEQRRDFIYIDDAVAALMLLIEQRGGTRADFCEYGLGMGEAITIREFCERVKQITGAATTLDFGALPYRGNEVMESCADIGPLEKLGWRWRVDLDTGIANTAETYARQEKAS